MKFIVLLVGARPNFVKAAPLVRAFKHRGLETLLVHTGQHSDPFMSDIFFQQLGIPQPDKNLDIGFADRTEQTRAVINRLVPLFHEHKTDALVVVGDVTSTAAGTIAAVQSGVPVAHVEAGLRSFHWPMPEELNRMIADHYGTWLFVTERSGLKNLHKERIPDERVHLVGNVMIDTLRYVEPLITASDIVKRLNLHARNYGVLTLHRPENVDDPQVLTHLWRELAEVAQKIPLIFPVHPRTKKRFADLGLASTSQINFIEPLGYVEMLALVKSARLVLTDSGGLQEETTVLGIPCLTLRGQTERPITVEVGTSEVVGRDPDRIHAAVDTVLRDEWKSGNIPELWDGHTAERIADILASAA